MIVLGVDQSYTRTGIAVIEDEELVETVSLNFSNCETKKEKRSVLRQELKSLEDKYDFERCVVERVRLYSRGNISAKVIVALGSMIAAVVDAIKCDVYSVDSRSWKARVVGSEKIDKKDAVNFVEQKFNVKVNHDVADAICLALYPFQDGVDDLMRKENY